MHKKIEIQAAAKLTNLKWLNMFDVSYVDPDGRSRSWQTVSRAGEPKCITGKYNAPDAVVIVPFHTAAAKLVVTREFRVPLADFEYGFPAGLMDRGETIEQTARRELMEETGLNLTRIIRISPPLYSSAGMTDESVAMVYAECDGQPSTAGNTGSELIEVQLISQMQAAQMCRNPDLKFDVKAWLVIVGFADKGTIQQ
jgi:ADP-ribose pyrophosphatase